MTDKIKGKKNELPNIIFDSTNNIRYKRSGFLGKGGFGKCFQITDTNTGNVYAGKIVSKALLTTHQTKEKLVQEIIIHKTLNHKNIVGFHGFFDDEAYIYIVLELCQKRSMAELQKRRQFLTDPEVRYYMKQVLSAVQYLHENKIIHRDLKLGNLFINNEMQVKVGDFGLSTRIESGERRRTMCGTPNYIAPEILEKKGHGYEVDVWSFGCIVFTLLVGKPPFETASIKETYSRIRRCDYCVPLTVNRNAADMIRKIFVRCPNVRPTVNDLIHHQFFAEDTPPSLPTSCLIMAPQFNVTQQTVAIRREPLKQLNISTVLQSSRNLGSQKQSLRLTAERSTFFASFHFLTTLKDQLLRVLDSKPVVKDANLMETEHPAAQPVLWISSWVDYSHKYGFAYKLCDNSIGIVFLDHTKLILMSDGNNIQYTDQDGCEEYFTVSHFHEGLEKKKKLLTVFQQFLGSLTKTGASMPVQESACLARLPVLCDWMRYDRTVVMLLSNGTLQINFFPDHSKMILCPLMGAVTLIDKKEAFWTYKLSLIEQYGCSNSLSWRLHYALRKINEMLRHRP
jgi:polo-like kinase 1